LALVFVYEKKRDAWFFDIDKPSCGVALQANAHAMNLDTSNLMAPDTGNTDPDPIVSSASRFTS
jgi:hypothetical protein